MPDPGGIQFDPQFYASLNDVAQRDNRGPFTSGLAAGLRDLQSYGGSVVQGAGQLFGLPTVESIGRGIVTNAQTAQAAGRQDLNTPPWREGGSPIVPWLEYQASRQVPLLASYVLAGRATPRSLVPTELEKIGAVAPRVLGGGGLKAGADIATRRAAIEAGRDFGRSVVGAEVAGVPVAFASMYQEAQNKPEGATKQDILKAAALSPFYAALDALEPAQFKGLLSRGLGGNIVKRVATAGLVSAAAEVPQEGIQTAMEQSFRTDLSARDKMMNIVDAAVTGGAVGGVFGGVAGIRGMRHVNPADVSTDDLDAVTNNALALPPPSGAPAFAQGQRMEVTPGGEVRPGSDYVPSELDTQRPPAPVTRPMQGSTTEELLAQSQTAQNYLNNLGKKTPGEREALISNYLRIANAELQNRGIEPPNVNNGATNDNVPADIAGAVERTASGGSAVNLAVPVPANTPTIEDTLKGISTRKSYLDAKDVDEVKARLVTRLENGSKAKGDLALADRLGVDLNAPAKVATAQEGAQGQAEAPVDESFQAQYQQMLSKRRGAAITALRENLAPNQEVAQRQIFDELGKNYDERSDGFKGLTELAKLVGLHNEEGQLTEAGVKVARQALPLELTVKEAVDRGYNGVEASAFDRGARGDRNVKLGSIAELRAFNDGRDWASNRNVKNSPIPETAAEADTAQQLADQGANRTVRSAEIPAKQQGQRFLNQAVDQVYGSTLKPTEQAQLKRMVREGATGPELDEAARYFASGRGALVQEQPATQPFKGVTIDRGPLIQARERARVAAQEAALQQGNERNQKSATAAALRAHADELKLNLRAAHDSGDITQRQLIAGLAKIQAGDLVGARNILPGEVSERLGEGAAGIPAGDAKTAVDNITRGWKTDAQVQVHQAITDVPPALRSQLSSGSVKGFFDRGTNTMHIIADNHASVADVHATVFHEMLGHKGLGEAFGERLDNLLKSIYRTNAGLRALANDYLDATGKWSNLDEATRQRNAVEEILAEGSEAGQVKASVWEAVTHLVREFGRKLGFDIKYNAADVQAIIARAHDAIINGSPTSTQIDSESPTAVMERTSDTVKTAIGTANRMIDADATTGRVRRLALGWMSLHGANEFYGKWFDRKDGQGRVVANGTTGYESALNEKNAIVARMAQMLTDVRDTFGALSRTNPDSAKKIVQLMRMSEFGINPTKPWKEQTEALRTSSNKANLEQLSNEAHNVYRALLGRGHAGIYDNLRNVNDVLMLSTLSVSLQHEVDADAHAVGKMSIFDENPMEAFMREQASRDFTPADARKWWQNRLQQQLVSTFNLIGSNRAVRDNPATNDATRESLATHIDDLGHRAANIQQVMSQLNESPYFHLGRYGNFFVGWKVTSPENMAKVADKLSELKFDGVVSNGTDKLSVYMRTENASAQRELDTAVRQMEKQGWIEKGSIRTGQRSKQGFSGNFVPQAMQAAIAEIEASKMDPDLKDIAKQEILSRSVDLMPEMSLARVLTKRRNIPGYSSDMMRSFDWRAQVGINALAGMVTAPRITQSFVDMRGALDDAETAPVTTVPIEQRRGMRDILDEYSRRERERANWPETHLLDQIKGIANAWFLGASVSYGFVNMTQLGTTLLPELAATKGVGFAKAFGAIAQATPLAFKIMAEVARHGKQVSLSRAMDAVITHDVLAKVAGKDMTEYLMRVVNTGNLDIGGPSRELIRSAEGRGNAGMDQVLRYASSMGYYTETASRLIAAIAVKKLNPNMSIEQAADQAAYTLNETMWNYSRTNQGRQFGKMGVLGPVTPLSTQFMQYQAQLTEKLFREAYTAMKGDTAEARSEARRYLKYHLSAMTVLAGTLGLPMVTFLAMAFDKLKDLWDKDEEPSDVRAAYRNWLASLVGKDAGEIIAHGGFRQLGFDVSQRLGEQDLIPFSKFLADRRAFKDKSKDLAFQTWGAPTSAAAGVIQGGEQMMDGNFMAGLTRMLPNALAAPVKAYKLTQDGYVDAEGKKLPMSESARAVLVQLLGFNPSEKAEYNEARGQAVSRKGALARDATVLRDQLAKAIISGDNDNARELIGRAQVFDRTNPSFAVLPHIGDVLRRRAKVEAIARATNSPLGVDPRDFQGQQMSAYANY